MKSVSMRMYEAWECVYIYNTTKLSYIQFYV